MEILTEIELQKWITNNCPADNMLWRDSWSEHVVFLRDRISRIFEQKGDTAEVVGEHYSKSILNPVVKFIYKDVEVLFQYNFYNWQIMVKSNNPLDMSNLKYLNLTDYFYYQGIPNNYHFKPYSKDNNKEFAVGLEDNLEDAYAFAIILKMAIDK